MNENIRKTKTNYGKQENKKTESTMIVTLQIT